MTYYMYFIQALIIGCTVSEILAEIDHKGPNWTFRTLKMTFRVIQYKFQVSSNIARSHQAMKS